MPAHSEVISSLVMYIHFSWMLHIFSVVRLIGCLQRTSRVTMEFLLLSFPPICVSAWVWKINDINPRIAEAFNSSWIRATLIKPPYVCMCCREAEDEVLYYGMAHIFIFSCRSTSHELAKPQHEDVERTAAALLRIKYPASQQTTSHLNLQFICALFSQDFSTGFLVWLLSF